MKYILCLFSLVVTVLFASVGQADNYRHSSYGDRYVSYNHTHGPQCGCNRCDTQRVRVCSRPGSIDDGIADWGGGDYCVAGQPRGDREAKHVHTQCRCSGRVATTEAIKHADQNTCGTRGGLARHRTAFVVESTRRQETGKVCVDIHFSCQSEGDEQDYVDTYRTNCRSSSCRGDYGRIVFEEPMVSHSHYCGCGHSSSYGSLGCSRSGPYDYGYRFSIGFSIGISWGSYHRHSNYGCGISCGRY